jgi:hypothetical protein
MIMLTRKSGWVVVSIWTRCGFIYSDYVRGIQRLFDELADFSLTLVVIPKTRVEYEIFWFGLELANVLCYQRSPIVRPLWWTIYS